MSGRRKYGRGRLLVGDQYRSSELTAEDEKGEELPAWNETLLPPSDELESNKDELVKFGEDDPNWR